MNCIHSALLLAALGLISTSSHGADWSLALDAGSARMEGEGPSLYDHSVGLRAAWWPSTRWAIEAGIAQTDNATLRDAEFGDVFGVDPTRSLTLGARHHWPLGGRAFAVLRGGAAYLRQTRDNYVLDQRYDPVYDYYYFSIEWRRVRASSISPYVGLGVGWRWHDRWSSSVELTRTFAGLANRCRPDGSACTAGSARLDTATLGISFDFD
jgi:hypothetical protein